MVGTDVEEFGSSWSTENPDGHGLETVDRRSYGVGKYVLAQHSVCLVGHLMDHA